MELSGKKQIRLTSYHNHTTWSDGTATLAEMIEGARKAGLDELGISDHFALGPGNRRYTWAMAPESLDDYVAEIQQAMKNTNGLTIRLGLEVDYFPETIELVKTRLASYPFDYLITSVHSIDDFPIDFNAEPWAGLSPDSRNQMWRSYWQRLRAAAETNAFDIIGHLDLPKKFNFYPSVDLTQDALAALDSIAGANMAIEMNCSGWDKPVGEAYPSPFYLHEAYRRKIPLIISADAHSAVDVNRNFDRARQSAKEAGYSELVRFERRKRFSYPL
jgi:histidinol-phosphatase (PHP family)